MTIDNEGNNKTVKKKAKTQIDTTLANDSATAKQKKKTKGRVEKASISDNDVPKKKKSKGQTGAEMGYDSDAVKKKKKAKKKKSKNEKETKLEKKTKSHAVTTIGTGTATKKKKMKNSAEKATGNSNDDDTSGLPQYVTQSTTQNRSLPTNLSQKAGDNQSFKEERRSRRKSILCIAIPVILLLLCIIAGVVVWQLGIFEQKTVIPKTTARMVVLEVTERKLTPLEINQDNIFGSGGVEEQALPGKR